MTLTPPHDTVVAGLGPDRLERLLAATPAIAGASDVEGVLRAAAEAACALLDAASAQALCSPSRDDGTSMTVTAGDAGADTGALLSVLVARDGSSLGALATSAPAGGTDAADQSALDALARVAAAALEARLRQRDELLHAGRELADVRGRFVELQRIGRLGLWTVDLETGALDATEHLVEMLDLDVGLFGATLEALRDRVHPDDLEALEAAARAAVRTGACRVDHRMVRRDGTVLTVHTEARAVPDADGCVRRLTGATRDVSEQRELEAHLRQAQRAETIGSMATGLAHDFNNLLTVIHGHTSLLLQSAAPGGSAHGHLEAIELAATRAAQLTAQLLSYSRRDDARQLDVSVSTSLVTIVKMLQQALDERIHIELDLVDDSWIRIDPGQLDQVIVNLVVNARDAMPGGGTIRLRTNRVTLRNEAGALDVPPGEYCIIEVHDQGVGMDRATLERILDPFFTTKATGTGLGLATVHQIVRHSGGAIRFSSAPGQGTTARVFLPAVSSGLATPSRPAAGVDDAPHVLVVDDDESVRSLVLLLLDDAGYRATGVGTVAEATEVLGRETVHVVIADLTLDGESGVDVVEVVRARYGDLPVVLMSGYGEHDAAPRDVTFLPKPFGATDLVHTVAGLVRR